MPSRRIRALALLVASAAVLVGCSGSPGQQGGGQASAPTLDAVTVLDDPGAWSGPSTAVLNERPIVPLTDGAQQLPASVIDAQGTQVTVNESTRILTLDIYGSLSRIVFELGLGDQVVGRDVSSGFPEILDRPLVTHNGHDLNAEAMLEVAPTVILTDTSLGPWDTVLQMRDAGIPVVVVSGERSIEGVGDLIKEVAAALGVQERGEALAERTDAEIAAMVDRIQEVVPQDPAEKLRIAFLYVRGQSGIYYLFGEGSGTGSLITALGGVDVAAEVGWQGMRPVTDEGLIQMNPDVLLMMTKGLESVNGVDGLVEHVPAVAQTTAGQQRRVVDMSDTQILSFGPNSAALLEALAVAIYAPDALSPAESAAP